MGVVEILIIGVGLSMDAFAVSVAKGLAMKRVQWNETLIIALMFGAFQGLMPLLGYLLGTQFARFVEPVDHWIAFGLLTLIGGKMIWDGFHDDEAGEEEDADSHKTMKLGELVMLAVATSIDAFAVGCSFAFIKVDIWLAVILIALVTFMLSLAGVALGHRFGMRYNKAAMIVGGSVLVLIGLKTLLEHLGVLSF